MTNREFRTAPYRPFSAFMPYDLKTTEVGSGRNGNGYFDPLNEKIDLEWGGTREDNAFNNYFDYFFSGEDVKVFIDGLFDEKDELDTASLAFVIKQEKQPLYGFWSYNYDAVMRGTRLITGELSIYTRYPRRMTSLLEKAAKTRMESARAKAGYSVASILGSDARSKDDEVNIEKYWLNSQLDRVTSDPEMKTLTSLENPEHNIFSSHPPFNLIIMYGIEELGLTNKTIVTYNTSGDINRQLNSDRILMTDLNERKTVVNGVSSPMKVVLQSIDIISMTTSYSSGGQPLVENYQFIARDMYLTDADFGKNVLLSYSTTSPDERESANYPTSSTTQTVFTGVKNPTVNTPDF